VSKLRRAVAQKKSDEEIDDLEEDVRSKVSRVVNRLEKFGMQSGRYEKSVDEMVDYEKMVDGVTCPES
jgi:DNA replication initiation complex subunit (GINS family)